jgi:hypothetical protein
MWNLDGMDDLFTILGLGGLSYAGGEVMKKVGHNNFALGLDIISFLLGFRVVLVAFKKGIGYVEHMFDLM